ncbi:MAG: thioredoxin family protein [Candidatus Aenigmatarchaeota archaeon]
MVEINVLKTKMCPHCPKASEMARKVAQKIGSGTVVKETFLDTPEGGKVAMKYRVMTVPAIVINNKLRFMGMPSEEALLSAVQAELK